MYKPTFDKILEILTRVFEKKHKKGGIPSRLSVLNRLVAKLGYYHNYRTMANIAFYYGVSKSCISDAVKFVETILIQDCTFSLHQKES